MYIQPKLFYYTPQNLLKMNQPQSPHVYTKNHLYKCQNLFNASKLHIVTYYVH
jgi:hypothetical protein